MSAGPARDWQVPTVVGIAGPIGHGKSTIAIHTAAALRITRCCGLATLGPAAALAPHDGVIDVPLTVGLA